MMTKEMATKFKFHAPGCSDQVHSNYKLKKKMEKITWIYKQIKKSTRKIETTCYYGKNKWPENIVVLDFRFVFVFSTIDTDSNQHTPRWKQKYCIEVWRRYHLVYKKMFCLWWRYNLSKSLTQPRLFELSSCWPFRLQMYTVRRVSRRPAMYTIRYSEGLGLY